MSHCKEHPGSHDHPHSPTRSESGSHNHSHAHGYSHEAGSSRTRLSVALGITGVILLAEVVAASLTGSLALLADAGHMATDSAGLVLALGAAHLSSRPATDRSTWGMRQAEVLGAALQAGMLAVVALVVGVQAVTNLVNPPEVASTGMLAMGVIGLVANVISLLVLAGGRGESLSMRAAFLEVAGDALGSVGVILAAGVIALTGWVRADTVASLFIVALIVPRAVTLLRATGRILMGFTPEHLDLAEVRRHVLELDDVEAVHDLHAWTIASSTPVLTAHVVVTDAVLREGRTEQVLDALQTCVARHFPVQVTHSTFQLEPASHREHEQVTCT